MRHINKTICVVFAILAALTLFFVMFANAQSNFPPSVPKFTVTMVDRSYDVPLTYVNSTNPFTGEPETSTQGGYHVENKTVDIIIENQPFTSINTSGYDTNLFYVIRWKGHFENWPNTTEFNTADYYHYLREIGTPASNSDYTLKTYLLSSFGDVPADGQIDFQVKAQEGYSYPYYGNHAALMPIATYFKLVNESTWSTTQTLKLSNQHENTTPTTTPTDAAPTATIPEFSLIVLLPLFAIPLITLFLLKKNPAKLGH